MKKERKIYTLEQCREDFIEMWNWIKNNPGQGKLDFIESLGDPDKEQRFLEMWRFCPVCEYVNVNFRKNPSGLKCSKCPIWGKVTKNDDYRISMCQDKCSPYCNWEYIIDYNDNFTSKQITKLRVYATEVLKLGMSKIKV